MWWYRWFGFVSLVTALGLLAACDRVPKGTPLSGSSLKLNVKQGEVHKLRLVREELLTQGSMGSKEHLSRHLGIDCTFRVLQVEPNGTAHIQLTIDRGFYKLGGALEDSDELPVIFKQYSRVGNPLANAAGEKLYLMITSDFRILHLEGMYDRETETGLVATIAQSYYLDSEETKTDALGDYASAERESMGFAAGRQICSDLMDLFPQGFYDTGDFGYSRDGVGVGFVRGPKCDWFVDTGGSGATVNVATMARFETQPGGGGRWRRAITYEMKGKKKGTLQVDRNKGWIVGGRIEEDYSGKKVVHIGETQELKYPASFQRITRYEQPKQ